MVYRRRRTTRRKRTFRKKRIFKGKKKMTVKRAYNGNFDIKCETRTNLIGKAYTIPNSDPALVSGGEGARAMIRWGSVNTGSESQYEDGHVFSPFATPEWTFWRGKFEEYQITGVKIQVYPARY